MFRTYTYASNSLETFATLAVDATDETLAMIEMRKIQQAQITTHAKQTSHSRHRIKAKHTKKL